MSDIEYRDEAAAEVLATFDGENGAAVIAADLFVGGERRRNAQKFLRVCKRMDFYSVQRRRKEIAKYLLRMREIYNDEF